MDEERKQEIEEEIKNARCAECGAELNENEDVYRPLDNYFSGAMFCSDDCLLRFIDTEVGTVRELAEEEY